ASSSASAAPMPLAAPVTTATASRSGNVIAQFLSIGFASLAHPALIRTEGERAAGSRECREPFPAPSAASGDQRVSDCADRRPTARGRPLGGLALSGGMRHAADQPEQAAIELCLAERLPEHGCVGEALIDLPVPTRDEGERHALGLEPLRDRVDGLALRKSDIEQRRVAPEPVEQP